MTIYISFSAVGILSTIIGTIMAVWAVNGMLNGVDNNLQPSQFIILLLTFVVGAFAGLWYPTSVFFDFVLKPILLQTVIVP